MKEKKYNQSETIIILRSKIKFAPYNPRLEDEKIVNELKKNFKRVGFLGGIVWNEETSNLLSGHKRVKALDMINNYDGTPEKDYKIKVEKINIDEKTEKEQNIFMNSTTVMGKFDYELLSVILPDIDPVNAGLNENDLNMISVEVPNINFGNSENIQNDLSKMDYNYEERKKGLQEYKKNYNDSLKERDSGDSYVTISFDNFQNKAEFMERFGFNVDDRFIKGEVFSDMIERTK
jgi:hypothetical protein